jgi:hypothetical protein
MCSNVCTWHSATEAGGRRQIQQHVLNACAVSVGLRKLFPKPGLTALALNRMARLKSKQRRARRCLVPKVPRVAKVV